MDLGKGWQFHQVVVGDDFNRLSGFSPGRETALNDKSIETLLSQLQRHPGAGRFARSSAIEIDVFFRSQGFQFLGKVVGFQPN